VDVRGVLFDFGSTLFAHDPLAVTIGKCARRLGLEMTDAQSAGLASRIDAAAMAPDELAYPRDLDSEVWKQRWEVLYGLADDWHVGLGESINAEMHDPNAWVPYVQSGETLRSLYAAGVLIGVVSNTGWDVREVFTAHAVLGFVRSFTLSYEVGVAKPDEAIFHAACESLDLAPGNVVMVGDDPRADGGAVYSGIRTVLLPALPPRADNEIGAILDLVGVDG
jgi:FMN phosphatase YigB (HAD superfamily)